MNLTSDLDKTRTPIIHETHDGKFSKMNLNYALA